MLDKIINIMPSLTTIAAILAPISVAIINNHHQYRIKRMELDQKFYEQTVLHKREMFERFLTAFNMVCHLKSAESISEYSSCYSLVYIYLPKPVRDRLGNVNLLINAHNWTEAIKYVDQISMDIARELDKLPIKRPRRLRRFCRPNSSPET